MALYRVPPLPEPIGPRGVAQAKCFDLSEGLWDAEFLIGGSPVPRYEGPVRITSENSGALRISGDLYVRRPGDSDPLGLGDPGEPLWMPRSRYGCYVRSYSCTAKSLTLNGYVPANYWSDSHFFEIDIARHTQTLLEGTFRAFDDKRKPQGEGAVTWRWRGKTLRRATVEIDKVAAVNWPSLVVDGHSIASAFAPALWNVVVTLGDKAIEDPRSSVVTVDQLRAIAATRAQSLGHQEDFAWQFYVQIHRKISESKEGGLGHMYDTNEIGDGVARREMAVAAEGVVISGPERKQLQDIPLAYLRTITHELGHAVGFANRGGGGTFMRPTVLLRDELGIPEGIDWRFEPCEIQALRHWPDATVRPGLTTPGAPEKYRLSFSKHKWKIKTFLRSVFDRWSRRWAGRHEGGEKR